VLAFILRLNDTPNVPEQRVKPPPDYTPMLHFIANVHGVRPDDALSVGFDHALEQFAALPRMFIEPDGSFVWTGAGDGGQPWQVDGNLIDRGDVLAYVELKGSCPAGQFDELLRGLGWPESPVLFQLLQRGLFLTEAEFRALAASETGAR
jgi:hypothetical protein